MRSEAKASSAGSRRRFGKSKPALLLCVLAASVATLALVVGSASGATTRFLVEVFGSSAQPTFPADRGMAYDQGADHLYVIDSTDSALYRFNANGIAANFPALGTNAIDGEGTGDETPQGSLSFSSNRQREQVAIDESGEPTDGNVYVTQSGSDVVDIFSSTGEYLGQLTESTEGGAFGEPCGVTVDDEGTVYVGDRGDDRIHVFDPAGAVPVNGDSAATSYATLVDPCTMAAGMGSTDGFLFVARSTAATLSKLDAATGELKYEIATGASTVSVDPTTGHVFVARNTGTSSSVDEYDASGAGSASMVSSFKPGQTVEGIALSSSAEQVYVARASTENVEVFGPAIVAPDVVTSPPSSNTGVRATLAGTVNPDGVELDECFFEWGPGSNAAAYTETTPCVETPAEIGTGTSPVAVHADIASLKPQGTAYHYRLVAKNPNATVSGANQNFTTPNTVFTEAATSVTSTEATLNGTVNPDGTAFSECFFEWGVEKASFEAFQLYPETAPCVPGPGEIGAGTTPVAVSAELSGLHPGTKYAYRLKAVNPNGAIVASQQALQTSGPAILASWSEGVIRTEAILKAEINPQGSATTYHFDYGQTGEYGSETPELSVGSDSAVHLVSDVLSDLQAGTTYHYRVVANNGTATNVGPDRTFTTYAPFAPDTDCANQALRYGQSANLPDCRAYEMVSPLEKKGGDIITLLAFGSQNSAFLRTTHDGSKLTYSSYRAFSDADSAPYVSQYLATRDPSGWSTENITPTRGKTIGSSIGVESENEFKAFSADLSHSVFLHKSVPLTPELPKDKTSLYVQRNVPAEYQAVAALDPEKTPEVQGYSSDGKHVVFSVEESLTPESPASKKGNLYEWKNGELSLVSILPDGTPSAQNNDAGTRVRVLRTGTDNTSYSAVSDDGSRIYWTVTNSVAGGAGAIYARVDGTSTIPVWGGNGVFWRASADGSKALFTVGSLTSSPAGMPLREFDLETEATTLIADNVHGVAGASRDLSYIYFTSSAALDAGAVSGQPNLYVRHEGANSFIATLGAGEEGTETRRPTVSNASPTYRTASVTSDGLHLAFMSARSLTGYDNTDIRTGKRNAQVFVYDAAEEVLTCASCRPSGARGDGRLYFDQGTYELYAAATIPRWETQLYRQRVSSADGNRLFFDSYDALVPRDTNGAVDVYQWEAKGTGGCQRTGGCVDLISTGKSPTGATFVESSASGADVFISTNESLYPEDPGLLDIYSVSVDGGLPAPPEPAVPCSGDACQNPSVPPLGTTPASANFRGAGDPKVRRNCGPVAKRSVKAARRAVRLRRRAKRASSARVKRRLHRQAGRLSRNAKQLRKRAVRCRRAARRAAR